MPSVNAMYLHDRADAAASARGQPAAAATAVRGEASRRRLAGICYAVAPQRVAPQRAAAPAAAPAEFGADLFAHDAAGAPLTATVPLRHRPYFIGSDSEGIPEHLQSCGPEIPMVWRPREGGALAPQALAAAVRGLIDRELHAAGALLLRGMGSLGIHNAEDFSRLCHGTGYDLFECARPRCPRALAAPLLTQPRRVLRSYTGGVTIRTEVAETVFPLSEEPPAVAMEPHSDNPYIATPPRKLFFFCESLPPDGWAEGGSPIVDTRKLYHAVDPAVREKFEALGIQCESAPPNPGLPGLAI